MKIALVGNQNSGKTTLFNLLTGSNQKIGNWPGVTIDKKTGIIKGTDFELVDLPGIYSLSPYTTEEEVSRNFLFEENPDLIINIIDATSIERSLYLTTQLMELDSDIIIALNMADIVQKKGIEIDEKRLSSELGIDIVSISALKGTGISTLISRIKSGKITKRTEKKIFRNDVEEAISQLEQQIEGVHKRFVAVKLLEQDILFSYLINDDIKRLIEKLTSSSGIDMEEDIANMRYEWIVQTKKRSVIFKKRIETWTDKLDKVFLNKYLGIPIFMVIMILVYFLSVGIVGAATVDTIDNAVGNFKEIMSEWLTKLGASEWSVSLVTDGIITGVGSVLNFLPQLIILFLCIVLLETTGYMSRISFLLDKIFRKFGLSGKALIPFIVGSGCSVPGIMTTRTVEDSREREMLITLTPFIPCSAKLPVISLFAGYFFKESAAIVTVSLYFMAIAIILFSAILMRKVLYKGATTAYISELPEYKLPNVKYVIKDVWEKSWGFVRRAGTVIFVCSILVWVLLSFSWKFEYGVDINESILASIGKLLSWIFYPMLGELSWGATVSILQGLIAKEQVISSMSIISGLASDVSNGSLIFSSEGLFAFFTPASAYAFMAFTLFSAPCISSIGTMRKEFHSTKKMIKAVIYQTTLAWILSVFIFVFGSFIEVII